MYNLSELKSPKIVNTELQFQSITSSRLSSFLKSDQLFAKTLLFFSSKLDSTAPVAHKMGILKTVI